MTEEENICLENCSDGDALAFNSGMFKAGNIREKLWTVLKSPIASHVYNSLKEHGIEINPGYLNSHMATWKWFKQGIECEILRIGSQGWKKGKLKIRVCLEFIPDEPENFQTDELKERIENKFVLDDIRQSIV